MTATTELRCSRYMSNEERTHIDDPSLSLKVLKTVQHFAETSGLSEIVRDHREEIIGAAREAEQARQSIATAVSRRIHEIRQREGSMLRTPSPANPCTDRTEPAPVSCPPVRRRRGRPPGSKNKAGSSLTSQRGRAKGTTAQAADELSLGRDRFGGWLNNRDVIPESRRDAIIDELLTAAQDWIRSDMRSDWEGMWKPMLRARLRGTQGLVSRHTGFMVLQRLLHEYGKGWGRG